MLRIERRERQLFWLAVVAGIGLWTYSRWPASLRSDRLAPWIPVFLVIGPSLLVYALTTRLHAFPWLYRKLWLTARPCWGVRRHPWIDLLLAIAAGYVAYRVYFQLFEIVTWQLVLTAIIGSGLGLYLVAIIANPRSALVVVNCPAEDCFEAPGSGVGPPQVNEEKVKLEKELARTNVRSPIERLAPKWIKRLLPQGLKNILGWRSAEPSYPLVWPFIFVAQVGGGVVWQINGPEGHKVEILFDEGYQPFGPNRTRFEADVPGCLAIGPVVEGGCGSYGIRFKNADGEVLKEVDPGGDNPPGDGKKSGGP